MKRILKYLTAICLVFLVIAGGGFEIKASENDALGRGYEISDKWQYVSSKPYEQKKVSTSSNYYGSMWSWMGLYKYYDAKNKELLVLLLCTSEMQSSQESSWDQKRFNNQKMEISFYVESSEIVLLNFSPETTQGEITISNSVNVSTEIGSDGIKLGYSVSQSTSYTTPDVYVKVNRLSDKKISISHNFLDYTKNLDLNNICCAYIKRNNLALFKIPNYKANMNNFYVSHESTFYRNGTINSSSVMGYNTAYFRV